MDWGELPQRGAGNEGGGVEDLYARGGPLQTGITTATLFPNNRLICLQCF